MLKSLHPGTKVYMEGFASQTKNPGEVVLMVTYLKFLGCSRNPEHIKGMLQRMSSYEMQSENELQFDNNGEGGSEKSMNAATSTVRKGLNIEEMDEEVFGPLKVSQLKEVLRGERKVESLFPLALELGAGGVQDDGMQKEDKGMNKIKIPFAKLARLIANQLPEDGDYPLFILHSKGRTMSKRNSSGSSSSSSNHGDYWYNALPVAPSDVMEVPIIIGEILNSVEHHQGEEDLENGGETSILALLKENEGRTAMSRSNGLITVSGWVQNRRRFQGNSNSIAVLELVEELSVANDDDAIDNNNNSEAFARLKCALHADCLKAISTRATNDSLPSDAYGHIMAKGSKVLLQGYISMDKDRPTLWVTQARLKRSTWRPATVKYFLDLIAGNEDIGKFSFEVEEVADALAIGHSEARLLMEECKTIGSTGRQWKAAEISRDLQDGSSRLGIFSDEMKAVLEEYKCVRDIYPLQHIEQESTQDLVTIPVRRRSASLRTSTEGSRWRGKKRPQLEFMARQVKEVVESHPDFNARPLNILDVGGGRGHLSNYLASVLGNDVANVHVIDIDSQTIKNGVTDAKRKGLDNVVFGVGDASSSQNVAGLLTTEGDGDYDIIVALHACGALSDVALGHAAANNAGFVITPCCFRSNSFLNVSLPSHGGKKELLMRPSEFLGMEEESMVALTSAAELQGDIKNAGEAIHTLCALRAQAVKTYWQECCTDEVQPCYYDVQIKTFPIGFSTRNYCIVGTKRIS